MNETQPDLVLALWKCEDTAIRAVVGLDDLDHHTALIQIIRDLTLAEYQCAEMGSHPALRFSKDLAICAALDVDELDHSQSLMAIAKALGGVK